MANQPNNPQRGQKEPDRPGRNPQKEPGHQPGDRLDQSGSQRPGEKVPGTPDKQPEPPRRGSEAGDEDRDRAR